MGLGCQCLAKISPSPQPGRGGHNSPWPECSPTTTDHPGLHCQTVPGPESLHLTMPVLPM